MFDLEVEINMRDYQVMYLVGLKKLRKSTLGLEVEVTGMSRKSRHNFSAAVAVMSPLAGGLVVMLLGSVAQSAPTTYTLPASGTTTGTWDAPSNGGWTKSGVAPLAPLAYPNRAGDTARTNGAAATTLSLDIPGGGAVTVGQLAKIGTGTFNINVGSGATAATLVLDNTGGSSNPFGTSNAAIENSGSTALTLGTSIAPLPIALKNTDLDIGSFGGSGNIVINADITNSGNTDDVNAAHTITLRSASSSAGTQINFAGSIGSTGSNLAFVNPASPLGVAFTANISGVVGPSVTSLSQRNSASGLNLTGANTYTGVTNVGTIGSASNGGTLSVGTATIGTGSINSTSAVNITGNGSKLVLDNTIAVAERINNSAVITTSLGGEFYIQNGASKLVENIGGLTIGAGSSTISLTSPSALAHELAVGSTGFARVDNGTALIHGANFSNGASTSTRLTINGASGTGLTYGGSTVSSAAGPAGGSVKNLRIVPYLIGTTSITGTGLGFMTYDTTSGLRILNQTNEVDSLVTSAGALGTGYVTSGDNVLMNGTGTLTLSSGTSRTFNSLALGNSNTTLAAGSASDTLTINSGGIISTGTATAINNFNKVTFGNGEGVVFVTGTSLTFSSPIDVTSSGGLTKSGSGALILNANNQYTGATIINQGSVKLGSSGSLAAATTVAAASGTTFDVNARATTIAGLNNVGGTGGSVTNTGAATTLTLGGSGAYSFAGAITASTPANLALTVNGGGSQILSGTNAYTGATSVTNGQLIVDGSLAAGSAVSVGGGAGVATLGGTGTVNGSTTLSGATNVIAAGSLDGSGNSTAGKLTLASLTAATGANLKFQVGATTASTDTDQVAITGAFGGTSDLDSHSLTIDLSANGAGPTNGVTYTLMTFGSFSNLTAADFNLGSHPGLSLVTTGFDTDGTPDGIFFDSDHNRVQVQFAVPEPTSLSILGLATCGLLARRRPPR